MEKKNELVKMSFFKGLKVSFDSIIDNFKSFMFFSLFCSLPLSALKIFLSIKEDSFVCFLVFAFIFLFVVSFFINCWFNVLNKENNIKNILKSFSVKNVFRTLFFVFANILAWVLIIGISMFLFNRVVEFNFWLEFLLYLGLSFIIMLCFIFLLNYVIFIRFLKREEWFVFRNHFWALYDNVNKIIAWTFVLFLMFFVLCKELSSFFVLPDFFVNMIYLWAFYFCLAFYISILNYQYEKIFLNRD